MTNQLTEAYDQLNRCKFENYLGRRIKKSQWISLKNAMICSEFEITDDNLLLFANLKNNLSFNYSNSAMVKNISDITKIIATKFEQENIDFLLGVQIWEMLEEILQKRVTDSTLSRVPNQSTLYSWFKESGKPYRTINKYDRKQILILVIKAYLYRPRSQSSGKSIDGIL